MTPPTADPLVPDDQPVLPTRSSDDTDQGWGEQPSGRDDDERFLREVPPHW